MKNSGDLQRFSATLSVAFAAGLLILLSSCWFYRQGYVLYYGDAQAHLNISRSIIDSRTPGLEQAGTVWLPVLHLLCIPLVWNDAMWSSGLAGTVPVSICLWAAAVLFWGIARDVFRSDLAAIVCISCLLFNPNLLYLGATPMTEGVFFFGLALFLFSAVRGYFALGVFACWWMCLTRYDGWFLLPFAALWFHRKSDRGRALRFLILASLAPVLWILNNWYQTSNPLDFFNGPYSAKTIQGDVPYPGLHNWPDALRYYLNAGQLCSGWGLGLCGVLGFFSISSSRALRVALTLMLIPLFYLWSVHSSGTPVRTPQLPPHDYYNSRYGIAVVFLAAFCAGAVPLLTRKRRLTTAATIIATSITPWLLQSREGWIVWKESQVNSRARRAWTTAGADYLQAHYRRGDGILAPFGDLTGIMCFAHIPIAEVLHEGNGPAWLLAISRPDLDHPQRWAIGQNRSFGPAYELREKIEVNGAPPLCIYRRVH